MVFFEDELRATDDQNHANVGRDPSVDAKPSVLEPPKEIGFAHIAREAGDACERRGPLQARPGSVKVDGHENQELVREGELDGSVGVRPESCSAQACSAVMRRAEERLDVVLLRARSQGIDELVVHGSRRICTAPRSAPCRDRSSYAVQLVVREVCVPRIGNVQESATIPVRSAGVRRPTMMRERVAIAVVRVIMVTPIFGGRLLSQDRVASGRDTPEGRKCAKFRAAPMLRKCVSWPFRGASLLACDTC